MLANLDTRGARGDRFEFAPDPARCSGFEVKAVELRQAARKENIDARFCFRGFAVLPGQGPKGGDMVHTEAKQAIVTGEKIAPLIESQVGQTSEANAGTTERR